MRGVLITIMILYCHTINGQLNLDFDSIHYVTYKAPGLYHISVNEDSVKYYSIVTGWEAWIYFEEYKGVSAKNSIEPSRWKRLHELSQSFIAEPAKKEPLITHAMRGRLEWYIKDSLVYFISFYESETRSVNLKELDKELFELISAPNKVYWEGKELCRLNYINESDSIVVKHFPNKEELRKPYDPEARKRHSVVKVLTEQTEIAELYQVLESAERVNPLDRQVYTNLYKQENYYLVEFFKNKERLGQINYHGGYYRNSNLCWRKIKCRRLVN